MDLGARSSSGYSYRSYLAQQGQYKRKDNRSKHGLASTFTTTRYGKYRRSLAERFSKKQCDMFKVQTQQVKDMLDTLIKDKDSKGIYVDKIHLNESWINATNEYRKGNYF